MTCQHFEEYLSSYLDQELETKERRELEGHLEVCSLCRGRLEEERRIKALLAKKVPWLRAPQALRDRIIVGIESSSGGFFAKLFSLFSIKPFPATATATAILGVIAVLGVILYLRHEPSLQAAPILIESVNHHITAFSQESPVEMTSSNPEEVSGWFRGRVSIPVHVPSFEGWTLLGGRVCYLTDRRVATLCYKKGKYCLSFYIGEGSGIQLKGMKERRIEGKTFKTGSHMGYNSLFWRNGDLLCFLVSPVGSEELIQLASSSP